MDFLQKLGVSDGVVRREDSGLISEEVAELFGSFDSDGNGKPSIGGLRSSFAGWKTTSLTATMTRIPNTEEGWNGIVEKCVVMD